MVKERVQAFVMLGDAVLFNNRGQIAVMALRPGEPRKELTREQINATALKYGQEFR